MRNDILFCVVFFGEALWEIWLSDINVDATSSDYYQCQAFKSLNFVCSLTSLEKSTKAINLLGKPKDYVCGNGHS